MAKESAWCVLGEQRLRAMAKSFRQGRVLLGLAGLLLVAGSLFWLSCQGTSSSSSTTSAASPLTAAFVVSPASPVANQPVQFTDTSTGTPTSWSWSFGDNTSSALQNPAHVYSAAGNFTVTLTVGNASGSKQAGHPITVASAGSSSVFDGTILLGAPTANAIKASVFSTDQGGTVYLAYGTAPGAYDRITPETALTAAAPLTVSLASLQANAQYYYRLYFQASGQSGYAASSEYTFHTARPAGSTFVFTIQADSHLDYNSTLALYQTALGNILADAPDFHVDLGDTFMCEKYSQPFTSVVQPCADPAVVDARYVYERGNFGLMSHSVPLFSTNGNHDGEDGWLANGTAQSLPVWTTLARHEYYLNPVPGSFYSGDATDTPYVGQRAAWYAWQWGDALFIVLDPFWNTTGTVTNGWNLTLGETQFKWLQSTLASNTAMFKFVFIHDLVGGLQGQMRGGVEAAPYFEWGGDNLDGTNGFAQNRPGWSMPIHQMLVKYGVTAVFHGHDHFYDHQELDGIAYQEVPQPSTTNYQSGPGLAQQYGYVSGTILSSSGHLRVTVSPASVKVQYVRAYLPGDPGTNGEVDDTWTVAAP
jgi:PKD repeat protein